ncbi:MAG: MBL fold metallo-hydrolase [Acidimicrobiales bacterium]|nr:MBL fold metallo-hydrolase [Acidimicrobiales bacterium]
MHVITLETPSLGDRSYIVHDGASALVLDPQRDVDRVLDAVAKTGATVTHVAETHVHNDYVSGGLVLARMTGATYVHAEAEPLRFDHHAVGDGDRFTVGTMEVEVVHTPGHTPHHLSYVVRVEDEAPAVFTGGSLLYGTVGRTDLISPEMREELTRAQHRTAHRLASMLPDETRVYPTHGFGSFCASAQSEGASDGTLRTEREINVALTVDDEDDFVERLVSGLSAFPAYYAHMGPLNLAGAVPVDLSPPAPVDPTELARRIHRGDWVVDLRQRRLFATEHLTGTIGIELADNLSTYLGWLIPWGTPVTLLGESEEQVADAQRQLVRIGIDRPMGASVGAGPGEWAPDHGRGSYAIGDFDGLAARHGGVVLDVRRPDELEADGAIPDSVHVPIDEILRRMDEIPDEKLWVHCASGFRASIAASLLDRAGYEVVLVDDEFANAAGSGVTVEPS